MDTDLILDKLKKDIDDLVASVERQLVKATAGVAYGVAQYMSKKPQEPEGQPSVTQPSVGPTAQKQLPWFKYGIRGFLNKLWYGNHPSNPNWKNESVLSLENRIFLENEINNAANSIINVLKEDLNIPAIDQYKSTLDIIFNDFKTKLFNLVLTALKEKAVAEAKDPVISQSEKWWSEQKDVPEEKKTEIKNLVNPKTGNFVGTNEEEIMRNWRIGFSWVTARGDINVHDPEDVKKVWPSYRGSLPKRPVKPLNRSKKPYKKPTAGSMRGSSEPIPPVEDEEPNLFQRPREDKPI